MRVRAWAIIHSVILRALLLRFGATHGAVVFARARAILTCAERAQRRSGRGLSSASATSATRRATGRGTAPVLVLSRPRRVWPLSARSAARWSATSATVRATGRATVRAAVARAAAPRARAPRGRRHAGLSRPALAIATSATRRGTGRRSARSTALARPLAGAAEGPLEAAAVRATGAERRATGRPTAPSGPARSDAELVRVSLPGSLSLSVSCEMIAFLHSATRRLVLVRARKRPTNRRTTLSIRGRGHVGAA